MAELDTIPTDQVRQIASTAAARSDFEASERALRELLRRAPRDVEVMLSLTSVLKAQGARSHQVEMARRAVGAAPRDARAQMALGSALAAMGQLDPARRAFEIAATLAPGEAAVHTALGDTLERLRMNDQARAACERAIGANPRYGPAYNLLGQLESIEGRDEAGAEWLAHAIRESPQPDVRATAWHRLGAIRERQGRWDEAFQCHQTANQHRLETPMVRRLLATPVFQQLPHQYLPGSEPMLARWAARRFTDGLPDPVFLVGFPRSGTTLTERILGAIPGTVTSDEEPLLSTVMRMGAEMCGNPGAESLAEALDGLTDEQVGRLRAEYWRTVERMISAEARRAPMFIDKAPLRFIHLMYISVMFLRAKVVFVIRDPRDCCLSCYFQDFAMNSVLARFLSLDTTGDAYAQVMTFWMRARTRVANPVLEVRYEDMVTDFEPCARRVVEFLGCAWSDEILRFHEKARGSSIRTPSYRAVTEPINTRAIGKWSRYESHLGPLIERVRPFLGPLGYAE